MEVIATGKLTTFPGQSKYQIVIEEIRPAGAGALMAMLEKRKAMLQAEGLFEASRKQALPYLPEVIGVVTSPSGAVIRDILHRLRDRFPRKVLIWPVAVQGTACAPEVARAIEGFNRLTPGGALPRPDLLIVARGGGSVEDLWGFNEEIVARAAAASDIPLISAVGHETDTTLIDFVSDKRAPTPTAAAELAVPVRMELMALVGDFGQRMTRALTQRVDMRGQRLRDLGRALPKPEDLVSGARQRLDLASERLPNGLRRLVAVQTVRLSEASGTLRPGILMRMISAEQARLADRGGRLQPALMRGVAMRQEALKQRVERLSARGIERDIANGRERLEGLSRRLHDAQSSRVTDLTKRLENLDRLRETLGYKNTLARGYAVVRHDTQVITTKTAAEEAGALEIEFQDGIYRLGDGKPARKASKPKPPEQGSLF
jgi:exodeoxyribonuclease VII large subunit